MLIPENRNIVNSITKNIKYGKIYLCEITNNSIFIEV